MRDRSASPVSLALRRMLRIGSIRVSVVILLGFIGIALYAPFIAGEPALVWWDAKGLRFPVLTDLFNQRSYPQYYDYVFNLTALLLPIMALGWFLLRHRWSVIRRLMASAATIAAAFALSLVPVFTDGSGHHHALWDYRPATPDTVFTKRERQTAGDRTLLAVLAPVPHRQDATYGGAVLARPGEINEATGSPFWLGTDSSGHDVCARMVFGTRISLTIGLVATGLSLAIGTLIGAISGYVGGWVDLVLQRLVEIMMCFPTFILVLAIVAMKGGDIFIIMIVLGLTGWAGIARLVRGEFLTQSVRDYVIASESIGVTKARIMFRHILPNAMTPLLISATFGIAGMVLIESGLAFLGLGDPNAPSWGTLLNQGRQNINYTWLIYVPGLAVFLLITALNLLGNGLREAFDPKSTQ